MSRLTTPPGTDPLAERRPPAVYADKPVPLLEVRVRGSRRQIGRAIGEAARPLIAAALDYYREHFAVMADVDFASAERRAAEYQVYARRYLPQYVEELQGMAEGSGQTFLDLLVPNCGEEFTCPVEMTAPRSPGRAEARDGDTDAPPRRPLAAPGCTAVAVCVDGRHVVGHNMDWYAVDLDKNILFDVTGPDGTRFLTVAGVPYLPILGLNSHGIAYVGNSVYSADARLGVPNAFVRRWVLDAASLQEARARATMQARARGSNHLLADAVGAVWDIETSAGAAALVAPSAVRAGPPSGRPSLGDPGLEQEAAASSLGVGIICAHTNHYAHPDMVRFEGSWSVESRDRLRRAQTLLAAGLARGDDPLALVQSVLRDHVGNPDAICAHTVGDPPPDKSVTVASMVCDLDEMRIHVCAGPPCRNPYRTYAF